MGILGQILDQFDRVLTRDLSWTDSGVHSITSSIVKQCQELFQDLEKLRDALYTRPGPKLGFRERVRWVFQASELQYLQSRVDSMKINLLLMMMLQRGQSQDKFGFHMRCVQVVPANCDNQTTIAANGRRT